MPRMYNVSKALARAWQRHRFVPHRWQAEALEASILALAEGKKGVVRAATGTGKSVAETELVYVLHEQLEKHERIIVSVPTQDLVDQMMLDMSARLPGKVGKWYEHERRLDLPVIVACHASMYSGDVFCPNCSASTTKENIPWPHFPLHGTALQSAVDKMKCEENDGGLCQDPAFLASMDDDCLAGALRKNNLKVKLWIADEAHKTETRQIISFEHFAAPESRIGFTATPFRSDPNQRITLFDQEIYEYGITKAILDEVIVPPQFVPYTGLEETDLDEACIEMIRSANGPGIVNAWDSNDAIEFADRLRREGIPAQATHHKLSHKKRRLLLDDLQRGKLKCLVHINLLAEGKNIPWLRWLCLRRSSIKYDTKGNEMSRTIARTRFIQEVGRALRAHPGKKEAIIYDPNNLWGELTLSYESLLGMDEEDIRDVKLRKSVTDLFGEKREKGERGQLSAVPVSSVEAYIQDRSLAFRKLGLMPFERIEDAHTQDTATDEQYGRLKALLVEAATAREIPNIEYRALEHSCKMAASRKLPRGPLQDLLGILHVLKSFQRWPALNYDEDS